MSALPGGLPADQGENAPIEESPGTGKDEQMDAGDGSTTDNKGSDAIGDADVPNRP